jgi:hypothetical protein
MPRPSGGGSRNAKVKWGGSMSRTRRRGLKVKVKKKGGQIVLSPTPPTSNY